MLEWTHIPYTISFIPEDGADDCSKRNYEDVAAGETIEQNHDVESEEHG